MAARLYEIDHEGRPPQRIDDLVSAYLPAVPADPLAAGAPMGLPYAVTTAPTTTPGTR